MELNAAQGLRKALEGLCPATQFEVVGLEIFYGPSPLASQSVVLCTLCAGRDVSDGPELMDRVKALLGDRFPAEHIGPARISAKGGAMGRLAAAISSDLVCSALNMSFGSGFQSKDSKRTQFWIEFLIAPVAVRAVRIAVLAIGAAIAGTANAAELIRREIAAFDQMCKSGEPNSESRVLIAGARARNIPILQMCNYPSLWQFGWGERSERFWVSSSNGDGVVGGLISRMKPHQKALFASLGIPTPRWRVLNADSNLEACAKTIGYPCVIKPVDSGGGKGVNAQIQDMDGLRQAVAAAGKYSRQLLMEEYQPGEDYRLMVVDGKTVMTIKRSPSTVTGDGKSTIDDLLASLNESRRRDAKRGGYLKIVPRDDGVCLALAEQGLALANVPLKGQTVRLRTNANHATGGDCTDVTEQTHEQIKRYAEQLALALGFRVLGVDYITPDISKSHDEVGGAFLEVNATPGLEVLLTGGIPAETIGALVLGSKPGRIPVCLLLADGENLEAIGSRLRKTLPDGAGAASADWAQLGAVPMPEIPLPPVERARSLLRYPALKSLVILWRPEELCRFGLPIDAVDAAIVVGAPPPDEWMNLLDRHAGKIFAAEAAGEATRLVSQWSKSARPERHPA